VDTRTTGSAPGDLRVSDAERDRAISELSEHFQAGRLTAEELDERSGRALRARTRKDLTALFTDLPRDQAPATAAAASADGAGPPLPRRAPAPRIAVAAPVIAIVIAVLASGPHGFGLLPFLAVLVIAGFLARAGSRRGHYRGQP